MISDLEREYCRENDIPLPQEPSDLRLQLMSAFRPAHYLYKSRCAKTGKEIFSSVPPDRGLVVYDVESWLSSDWDARNYGRDYDFSRPFFEQFADLMREVPLPILSATHASLENSPYCNYVTAAKNCYLVFSGQQLEDCLYGRFLYHSRDILDSFFVRHSERCYGSKDLQSCYNLHFSQHCQNCSDSFFLFSCRACRDCFECVNLSNKQFCWRNEQLSENDWRKKRESIDLGHIETLTSRYTEFQKFIATKPVRCVQGERYENSTGNFLNQVTDCSSSFCVSESESVADCIWLNKAKSCIVTLGFGADSELLYYSTGVGNRAYNVKFSLQCRQSVRDLEYCMCVEANSHNCFGCISVRNGSHCILNKQYSPEDYFTMLGHIKTHMRSTGEYGKFFPAWLSPYNYNESDGALFFPVDQVAAENLGFSWSAEREASVNEQSSSLPMHISDATDEILQQSFVCTATSRRYRIQKKELELLRQIGVALPTMAPFERIRRAGEFLRWRRVRIIPCGSCGAMCHTACDPMRENVFCEVCYQKLLLNGESSN